MSQNQTDYFDSIIGKNNAETSQKTTKDYFDTILSAPSQTKKDADTTSIGTELADKFNTWVDETSKPILDRGHGVDPVSTYKVYQQARENMLARKKREGFNDAQLAEIAKVFDEKADPLNKENWLEIAKDYTTDIGKDTIIGLKNIIADVLAAVPENIPVLGELADNKEKELYEHAKGWESLKSDRYKINQYIGEKTYQDALANGDNEFVATMKSVRANPMQVASLFAQQAPQFLLGAVGKGAFVATNILGGAGRLRKDIEQAYDDTLKTNPKQLLTLPEIQQRMAEGMSFEQAVNDAKTDVSDNWSRIFMGALISGTEAISPLGKIGQGLNRGVLGTLGKEVAQEAFQEGAEQLNSNAAVGRIDGKTQLTDGVVRNATLGGIVGLGMGIPSAIDAHLNDRKVKADEKSKEDFQKTVQQQSTTSQPNQQNSTHTINAKVMDNVLNKANLSEEDRQAYEQDIKNDLRDGTLQRHAEQDPGVYGEIAREYLAQTGQQVPNQPQPQQTYQEASNTQQPNAQYQTSLTAEQIPLYQQFTKEMSEAANSANPNQAIAQVQQKYGENVPLFMAEISRQLAFFHPDAVKAMQEGEPQKANDLLTKENQEGLNQSAVETQAEKVNAETTEGQTEQPQIQIDENRLQQYQREVETLISDIKTGNITENQASVRYFDLTKRFPEHHSLAEELSRREKAQTKTEIETASEQNSDPETQEQQALYSRSPMKSVEANIHRGRERMTQAILTKSDVKRGMYNQEFGWVDFVWGDDGTTKPLGRNGEPAGRGISHIFEARQRKDGMTEQQVSDMLVHNIVETIAKGEVKTRTPSRLALEYKSPNEPNGHKVLLTKNKGSNAWVLSGYEIDPNKGRKGEKMQAGRDTSTPTSTHTDPTHPRADMGASLVASGSEQIANVSGLNEQGSNTALELGRPANPSHLNDTHAHSQRGRGVVAENGKNIINSATQVNQQVAEDTEIQQAREVLRNALGEHADKVEIVRTKDLDPNDPNYTKKSTSEGWYQNGKQYINLDIIKDGDVLNKNERLVWVAWHELAHHGVRMRYQGIFNNIFATARKNPVVSNIARLIAEERASENIAISKEEALEEALVEIFSAQQTGNWAELESRYHTKIHHSWKNGGKLDMKKDISFIAKIFKRLISLVTGKKIDDVSDKALFDILAGIKQGIAENAENQTAYHTEPQANEVRYSLNERADSAFANMVDRVVNGYQGSNKRFVQMGTTPNVLKILGLPDTKISMREDVFNKVLGNKHFLTPSDLKRLPEQLNNPIAVTRSRTKDNGYLVFTELNEQVDGVNKPVVAALHVKVKDNGIEVIDVASTYGRNINQINEDLKQVLYWNKTKGYPFANRAGLQLPNVILSEDNLSANNIKTEQDLSQYVDDNVSQDLSETSYNQAKVENTTNGEDDIRFSRPKSESLEKLRNAETIRISGKDIEPSTDLREYKRNALNYGKTLRGTYTNKDTGQEIQLGMGAVKEVLNHDYKDPDHLQSVAAIPQIIEQATYIDTLKNEDVEKHPNIVSYDYYVAGLNIGGDNYTVKAVVAKAKDGSRYYDHKLSDIEKGDLLEMTSRLSSAEISNSSPLSDKGELLSRSRRITTPADKSSSPFNDFDDKRLLQILQDENATNGEGEDDIRFSRRPQSVLEQIKSGKRVDNTEGIWQDIIHGEFKQAMKRFQSKVAEGLRDETRPLRDWVDSLPVSRALQKELSSASDRADLIRMAKNSEVIEKFFRPLMRNLGTLRRQSKKKGKEMPTLEMTKYMAEYWYSARWSIIKSKEMLEKERVAMEDARKAWEDAKVNDTKEEIARAYRAFARAETQYNGRKADVETTVFGRDAEGNPLYQVKVGQIGGWSIPHAQAIMAEVETYFDPAQIEIAMKPLRDAVRWNLEQNKNANRITPELYREFVKQPEYVPLTGDPRADADSLDDLISGASGRGVNTQRDKGIKGRFNSEADGAIDAVNVMLDKTNANTAWQPFKDKLDEIYQELVEQQKANGLTQSDAERAVRDEFGLSRAILKGLTRTSDNVIIRKFGNISYEYRLPDKVTRAVKGSQKGENEFKLFKPVTALTGYYARGVTQYRPTFAITNMIRDVAERATVLPTREILDNQGNPLSQKEKDKIAKKMWRRLFNPMELGRMMKATSKLAWKGKEALDDNDPHQKALKQLIDLGGASTFRENLYRTERSLLKALQQENMKIDLGVRMANRLVAAWNGMFDYISSITAFISLTEAGITPEQAAEITLNLTNFNKVGKWTKHVRGLYAFLNPTLQGAGNLADVLSTKKGWATLVKTVIVLGALQAGLMYFDDDDDELGNRYLRNDLTRNLLIPMGEKDSYFKVPIGYGLPQLAATISSNGLKAMYNQITPVDAAANILTGFAKNFTPVAPSEIPASKYLTEKVADTFTPTLLKPVMQQLFNRNAFGSQITYSNDQAKVLRADQGKSTTSDFWKDLAVDMHETMGWDIEPELYQHYFNSYKGFFGIIGEWISDAIENPNRALHGKEEINGLERSISAFHGKIGQNSPSNFFYEAKGEAELLAKERESYKERKTEKNHPLTEKERKLLRWNTNVENALKHWNNQKRKLNQQHKEKKISDAAFTARIKVINANIERIHRNAVAEHRKIEGLRTR